MSVDNDTVKKIAYLSRLRVDDDKLEETKQDFNKILAWVDQLKEIDVEGIKPVVSVNENPLCPREDVVNDGNQKDAVLANAPMSEFGYFAVPKVVE